MSPLRWLDGRTISFTSFSNPSGLNPEREFRVFSIKIDGTGLRAFDSLVASPGAELDPTFSVAGRGTNVGSFVVPGTPVDDLALGGQVRELFVGDLKRNRFLQLTNFGRSDTFMQALARGGGRAYFRAAADPLGKNPTANCQLFSISVLGSGLRQLTRFREGDEPSVNGCYSGPPPGCSIGYLQEDPGARSLVFTSQCFSSRPGHVGMDLVTVRRNGSRLRPLTATRGMVEHDDGSVEVEMVGPWAYSPVRSR